jgi:hypothetical protein
LDVNLIKINTIKLKEEISELGIARMIEKHAKPKIWKITKNCLII